MPDVWMRNPHNYIREMVEAGSCLVAWDRGQLQKSKVDLIKHADLYFGEAFPWRSLAVGIQGTAEYRSGDEWFKPTAVYPTWEYGDDIQVLEELMENPVGQNERACNDTSLPGDERPVFGQAHMVIVTNIPDLASGPGRSFMTQLRTLQEDYPEAILHLHGLYSWRAMFGMQFKSVDFDPRTAAQKGNVHLPTGKMVSFESAASSREVPMLGFKPVDLKVPRNRCIFNMKSTEWAADNYDRLYNFRLNNPGTPPDTSTPQASYKPPETKSSQAGLAKAGEGDKFSCNTCSLQDQCKHFREGAVCSLPGAEPKELALFFKTRDADQIIDGLGTLAAANARRLTKGMAMEDAVGDIDPNVTRLVGQVFEQGTKLAKLIDPNLRGGTRVQVNVGQGGQAAVVTTAGIKQNVAQVFRELESRGYTRDQITPDMIASIMGGASSPEDVQRSVEGHRVIEG